MTFDHARNARKTDGKCTRAFSLRPCSTQRLPWRPHQSMNNAAHIEVAWLDAAIEANLKELGF
jgi:hypothetical protein